VATTISGHRAITTVRSPLLATRRVPGRPVSLRTHRAFLPLYLRLAVLLDINVAKLSTKDTWSYAYRAPRMGSSVSISDHAGFACDFWSAREGAHTWPSRMSKAQAEAMSGILERFRTVDGRHLFGWGACNKAPGVIYTGPTYNKPESNDPMHVFVARGVSALDALRARRQMHLRADGTVRR
jgi:hypothetical protein